MEKKSSSRGRAVASMLVWLMLETALLSGWSVLIYGDASLFSRIPSNAALQYLMFAMGLALVALFWAMTKGFVRLSGVGAQFRLDGLPGRLLALDSQRTNRTITKASYDSGRKKLQADADEASHFSGLARAGQFGVRFVMVLILLGSVDAYLRGGAGADWRRALILLVWAMVLAQGIHLGIMALWANWVKILDLKS